MKHKTFMGILIVVVLPFLICGCAGLQRRTSRPANLQEQAAPAGWSDLQKPAEGATMPPCTAIPVRKGTAI
jgi:hypothetical protein